MDAEQDLAATRMAAANRGRQARKEAGEQKQAASKVAAAQRGKNVRKQKAAEDKAAVSIQCRQRGKRERGKAQTVGQRYMTPMEVAAHNRFDDLWVSSFGVVYDLTSLVASNPGSLVTPMIDAAGTDISHWFDPVTKNVRTFVDPETEFEMPFTPMGAFLHCPPPMPTADWSSDIGTPPRRAPWPTHCAAAAPSTHPTLDSAPRMRARSQCPIQHAHERVLAVFRPTCAGTPWWKEKAYSIGKLTQKTRKVTLFNMLTKQATTLEVCMEETLEEIQRRYLVHNGHSASYTWKHTDKENGTRLLEMRETLDANGIADEDLKFDTLNIDPDTFIPIIHLYFSDDLTVA